MTDSTKPGPDADRIAKLVASKHIAQSNAEPVGWQAKPIDEPKWSVENSRFFSAPTTSSALDCRPLYTAPPSLPEGQSNAHPEWDCATQGCKNAEQMEGLAGCAVKYRERIKELEAQSGAQPVARQYRWRINESGPWSKWTECDRHYALAHAKTEDMQFRSLYTAPPRPDASGLIEAADMAHAKAMGMLDGKFAAELFELEDELRTRAANRSAT